MVFENFAAVPTRPLQGMTPFHRVLGILLQPSASDEAVKPSLIFASQESYSETLFLLPVSG